MMQASSHNKKARLLVVDDEPDLRLLYAMTLEKEGHYVSLAGTVGEALALLSRHSYDIVITDMRLPDGQGLDLLRNLRTNQRDERCLVITAYGSAENAVVSLKAGAFDYLTKPVDLLQLRQVVSSAMLGLDSGFGKLPDASNSHPTILASAPASSLVDAYPTHGPLSQLIGRSVPMQQVRDRIKRVANSMAPVLILGESGTGKELAAKALHGLSHRRTGPWVAVNCSAIPENLLESEFFGSKRGAFTGATQDRGGFFQSANGGTLFLDEIGDLPLPMQAKLLRAIQERRVRSVGAAQEEPVDVRILSATHKDLGIEVRDGRFRQDLYYRLNVIEVHMPPLRERLEDLPELCAVLLQKIDLSSGRRAPGISPETLRQLASMAFPGNVRELENLLHRALAFHVDGESMGLKLDDLTTASMALAEQPVAPSPEPQASDVPLGGSGGSEHLPADLQSHLDQQERAILVEALKQTKFNRTAAAARLGISLRQIRYRMARLAIDAPEDGNAGT
jgi:two-component system, NtrC family, response regulator PilR